MQHRIGDKERGGGEGGVVEGQEVEVGERGEVKVDEEGWQYSDFSFWEMLGGGGERVEIDL